MKKNLLSIALLSSTLFTNSASAFTVYQKDNFTWSLKGDFQIQIRQRAGADEDLFVDNDDAELKNTFKYKLGENLKAFAQADFDLENEELEEAYIGFGFSGAKIILGQTDLPTDDFGHEAQYEGSSFEDAFNATADESDNQLRFEYEFGSTSFAVSTDIEDPAEPDEDGDGQAEIDVNVITEFGNFDLGFAYQRFQPDAASDSIDTYGVAFGGKVGAFKFGIDYSDSDILEVLHLVTKYKVGKTTFATGYEVATEEATDIDSWYVNATYKFNKNVSILGEVHNTDEDDSDAGFLVGARVKF